MVEPVDPNAENPPSSYQPPPAWAPQYQGYPPAGQPGAQPYNQPYGQPANQPYYQPYGQPANQPYNQPYGTGWPPPSPPSNRRRWLLLAGVLVVIVAGGVTAAILLGRSSSPSRLSAPQSFGAYHKLDNAASAQVDASIRSFANATPAARGFFNNAAIASYASDTGNTGDSPSVILVILKTSTVKEIDDSDPQTTVDELLSGAVSDSHPVDPGPHGGAMNCGSAQFGTASETMCGWADAKTVGLIVSVRPALDESAAAQVTLDARDAID